MQDSYFGQGEFHASSKEHSKKLSIFYDSLVRALERGIPEFLDSGHKTWTLGSGRWTLDAGLWTLDSGRWALDAGRWALSAGLWTLDAERWALGTGHYL